MYNIYIKRKSDARFRAYWCSSDDFEKVDKWLENIIRDDNEHNRRGKRYQIRKGKQIIREVEN